MPIGYFRWNNQNFSEEDLEGDVDDVPPTLPSGKFAWYVYRPKQIVLIEALSDSEAKQFAYDEFGLQNLSLHDCFATFEKLLEKLSLTERMVQTSKDPIWSRTKERKVIRSEMDGMCCNSCGSFYQMAVANLPGGKLKCFSCKSG